MNNTVVNLSNNKDRDANIATLQDWHPAFYEIHPRIEGILTERLGSALEDYSNLLIRECPNDSPSELYAHIECEVLPWIQRRLIDIAEDAFENALSNQGFNKVA